MEITNSTEIYFANHDQMQKTNNFNQDSRLKSIQNQITNVQNQIQSLSSNDKLSSEEKMLKRKELQQQLQYLNKQMMQIKMEIQQQKREKAEAESGSQKPLQNKTDVQKSGVMGTAVMQGIIRADTSMKQANTLQSVKTSMEGKAGILESEIKLDKARGLTTEKKEAELAALNENINDTTADMMNNISNINVSLEKSREEETEAAKSKEKGKEDNQVESVIDKEENSDASKTNNQKNSIQSQISKDQKEHRSMDIKL